MDETKIFSAKSITEKQISNPVSFGNYILESELGQGAMGKVYKAVHRYLKRTVALKMPTSIKNDIEMKRFLREAETMAQMQHPNIIHIHEVGNYNKQPYLTMDFIDGQDLSDFYKNHPLSSRQIANIMIAVCEAIHYAHSNGIIHRDLKPANIMIRKDSSPVIMDFGLAKKFDDHQLSQSGMIMGTLVYMSPEQAQGKNRKTDERSDIYSLGVILYELLTGRPPFVNKNSFVLLNEIVKTPPIHPREIKSKTPKELENICLKAIEKKPSDRYQTAQEFAEDLKNFLEERTISARAPKMGKFTIQKNKVFVIIFCTLFGVSAFIFLIIERQQLQQVNASLIKKNQDLQKERELFVNERKEAENLVIASKEVEENHNNFSFQDLAKFPNIQQAIDLIKQKKYSEAIVCIKKCLSENNKSLIAQEKGELHYQIGIIVLEQNNTNKKEESYYHFSKYLEFVLPLYYVQKMTKENIQNLRNAHFQIGKSFFAWDMKDSAWFYFEKATTIDHTDIPSCIQLAETFVELDLSSSIKERVADITSRTIDAIEKTRKIHPENSWLKAHHGKILGIYCQGMSKKGIQLIEEAIQEEEDNYWMYMMIAEIYKSLERNFPLKIKEFCQKRYATYQESEKHIKNENPEWTYYGNLECAEILGLPIDQHVEKLLDLINKNQFPEYLQEYVYQKQLSLLDSNKDLEQMDEIYDKLANIDTVKAEKFYHFAELCKKNNKIEMAKKHYLKYLQKTGNAEDIKSAIEYIHKK